MQIDEAKPPKQKNKKKHKRKRSSTGEAPNLEATSSTPSEPKRKKKLIKQPDDRFQVSKSEAVEKSEPSKPGIADKKKESNRQRKRKKHLKLLEEKKTHTDIVSQQKALNYLSQWKHNKEEWKFEKLRQVWLQQNLFSSATLPDKYWGTAMEYFSNSKGQSRQTLIKEAMKIIESAEKKEEAIEGKQEEEAVEGKQEGEEAVEGTQEEKEEDSEEEEEDAEINTQLNRAREMLQYLQE